MTDLSILASKLSEAERAALLELPLPREGKPWQFIAARGYGDLWRKASKHWDAMLSLEEAGIVERRVSRHETLWRPTKPLGLSLRSYLKGTEE